MNKRIKKSQVQVKIQFKAISQLLLQITLIMITHEEVKAITTTINRPIKTSKSKMKTLQKKTTSLALRLKSHLLFANTLSFVIALK